MERGDDGSAVDAEGWHRALVERLATAFSAGAAPALAGEAAAALAEVEAEFERLRRTVAGLSTLHASPDRPGVLSALERVVRELIGSDELVVYERAGGALVAARAHGVAAAALRPVPLPADETAVAPALAWTRARPASPSDPPHTLCACVPLLAADDVVGAVAIYRMREHRTAYRGSDRVLLGALGVHGGAALQRVAGRAPGGR